MRPMASKMSSRERSDGRRTRTKGRNSDSDRDREEEVGTEEREGERGREVGEERTQNESRKIKNKKKCMLGPLLEYVSRQGDWGELPSSMSEFW